MSKYSALLILLGCLGASANAAADNSDVEYKVQDSQFSVYAGGQGVGFHYYFDDSTKEQQSKGWNEQRKMDYANIDKISKKTDIKIELLNK